MALLRRRSCKGAAAAVACLQHAMATRHTLHRLCDSATCSPFIVDSTVGSIAALTWPVRSTGPASLRLEPVGKRASPALQLLLETPPILPRASINEEGHSILFSTPSVQAHTSMALHQYQMQSRFSEEPMRVSLIDVPFPLACCHVAAATPETTAAADGQLLNDRVARTCKAGRRR